jgi:hypothetical protein
MTPQLDDRVFAIRRCVHFVAVKTPLELIEKTGVILDDQKFSGLLVHSFLGVGVCATPDNATK